MGAWGELFSLTLCHSSPLALPWPCTACACSRFTIQRPTQFVRQFVVVAQDPNQAVNQGDILDAMFGFYLRKPVIEALSVGFHLLLPLTGRTDPARFCLVARPWQAADTTGHNRRGRDVRRVRMRHARFPPFRLACAMPLER
jgi:hypothetical protein